MSKQDNINTQKKFGEAINNGQFEKFHQLMSKEVVDHDPAPSQGPGPDGFINFFKTFSSAFPDMQVSVEQMVADEENVAIAYTITGTHKGNFMGIPATDKNIHARGVQIARFDENAKIVERWGSSNELGILQQIGAQIAE